MTAIFPDDARVMLAQHVKEKPIHVAWGSGSSEWDSQTNPPAPNPYDTALVSELGRRIATADYVVADSDGELEFVTGVTSGGAPIYSKFSVSATPTRRLVVSTRFLENEAPNAQIREFAVCVDSQVVSGLPPGQEYFTPDQVVSRGRYLQIEHIRKIERSPFNREYRKFLIIF